MEDVFGDDDLKVGGAVGNNLLELGSRWFVLSEDPGASLMKIHPFDKIKAAVQLLAPADFQKGHVTYPRRDKERMKAWCATRRKRDTLGLTAEDEAKLCPYFVDVKYLENEDCAIITNLCLEHGIYCNLERGRSRRPSTTSLLKGGSSLVLATTRAPMAGAAYRTKANASLVASVQTEGAVSLTAAMAGRFLRSMKNDTFEDFAISIAQVLSLVEECRRADPGGEYLLNTKPWTHEIPGVSPDQLIGAREFVNVYIWPSSHLHMWQFSRRIAEIDCGHLRGRIRGVYQAMSTQDANGANFTTGFVICSAETKQNYDDMFDVLNVILVLTILALITDKFQGLKRITLLN